MNRSNYTATLYSVLIISGVLNFSCFAQNKDSTNSEKHKRNLSFAGIALPGISPENGFYVQGGLVGLFKADPKDSSLRSSNLYLFGLYSQYNQYRFSTGGDVFTKKENYYINGWLYYSYLPELFFGTGNNVSPNKDEFIDYRVIYLNGSVLRRFYKKWFAGPMYTFERLHNLNSPSNGIADNSTAIGLNSYSVSAPGIRLRHDSRDFVTSSTKGFFIDMYFNSSGNATGSDYSFRQTGLDIRKFINLTPKKYNVLAFNFLFKNSFGQVPFRFLPNIDARGYHPNLYRNNSLVSLQAEYRLQIWRWIGASLFGGISDVANSINNIDLRIVEENYGGGLRFRVIKKHNMYLRVEYGRGKSSSNYYVSFYDAF